MEATSAETFIREQMQLLGKQLSDDTVAALAKSDAAKDTEQLLSVLERAGDIEEIFRKVEQHYAAGRLKETRAFLKDAIEVCRACEFREGLHVFLGYLGRIESAEGSADRRRKRADRFSDPGHPGLRAAEP